MSAHLFDRWADVLAREGIVSAEDVELYSYGLSQGLLFLLNIGTAYFMKLSLIYPTIIEACSPMGRFK